MRISISAHAHIYVRGARTPPIREYWKRHCVVNVMERYLNKIIDKWPALCRLGPHEQQQTHRPAKPKDNPALVGNNYAEMTVSFTEYAC